MDATILSSAVFWLTELAIARTLQIVISAELGIITLIKFSICAWVNVYKKQPSVLGTQIYFPVLHSNKAAFMSYRWQNPITSYLLEHALF